MGLFSGGGFFGEVGGAIGLNTDSQEDAIQDGVNAQAAASEAAIAETRAARLEAKETLQPFVDTGERALARSEFLSLLPTVSPESGVPAANLLARGALDNSQQIRGAVSNIQGLDPNILNSPFFKANQEEASRNIINRAAALGKRGAGSTEAALARESLLLGNQFGQQDLQNRMATQNQRFGQLQNALGFGVDSGLATLGFMSDEQQREVANNLGIRGQRFGEQQFLTSQGQASAAGQANQAINTGANVSNLLTGIGNAQAAGSVAQANAQSQGSQNFMNLAGGIGGALLLSDRRLKRNIKFVGKTNGGNNWYTYDYVWGQPSEGVMADEVQHIDGAVLEHKSGFKMVNYGVIT